MASSVALAAASGNGEHGGSGVVAEENQLSENGEEAYRNEEKIK
jgi:hypothetical protein